LPPKSIEKIGEHDKINHFIAYAVLSLNFGLVVKNFLKKLGVHFL